jgi:phosphatidylglycerol:prolipoprotein diacylglycerol transferase
MGFLEVRFYGIVYALGFLLVYWLIYRKRDALGIKREQVDNLILILLIGLLVGARLFHFLFSDPLIFFRSPLEILKIWNGGMSFFGALIGCLTGAIWYLKKIKLNWKKFADIIIIGVTVALIFGRIANFLNGELIGTVTNVPWCVIFTSFDYLCRHPYQIYASISHVLLLGGLLYVDKLRVDKNLKNGVVFWTFILGYSLLRFVTDFFRVDPRFLGLTVWQYLSLVVFVGSLIYIKMNFIKKR